MRAEAAVAASCCTCTAGTFATPRVDDVTHVRKDNWPTIAGAQMTDWRAVLALSLANNGSRSYSRVSRLGPCARQQRLRAPLGLSCTGNVIHLTPTTSTSLQPAVPIHRLFPNLLVLCSLCPSGLTLTTPLSRAAQPPLLLLLPPATRLTPAAAPSIYWLVILASSTILLSAPFALLPSVVPPSGLSPPCFPRPPAPIPRPRSMRR